MKNLFRGMLAVVVLALGACSNPQQAQQFSTNLATFNTALQADIVASCPAVQGLANVTDIVAPVAGSITGYVAAGQIAPKIADASAAACNKVTGQLATGTTAVPAVPAAASPSPAVPAPATPASGG